MTSDTPGVAGIEELHAMAAKLGLRRAWFQFRKDAPGYIPHYDLRPSKRILAIRYGALAVESIELVRRYRAAQARAAEPVVPTPDGLEAGRYTGLFSEAEIARMTPAEPVLPPRIREMHRVYGLADGKRCKTCKFLKRYQAGGSWLKCGRSKETASTATDWRAGWPACGLHEESTDAR